MSSVRYYNQTAPFWDWVAGLEQGSSHPFATNNPGEEPDNDHEQQHSNPWTEGWGGFPFGPFPHRGRHGFGHHDMPPPPPEKAHDPEEGPSEPRGPPPPFSGGPHHGPGSHPHHHGGSPRGRCGGRGRGGFGRPGRSMPFGPHAFGGPMGGFGALANMFQDQIFGNNTAKKENTEDLTPEVDVFDTPESFVVHVSLPGAKKEDVGVNYDAEKSELNIAGVIYRPGDEELLKSLALDERKVGAFERKVRLGSRANPASIDVDAISARMEDGVLRVDVPKLDAGYVEVKKVDIE